MELRFIVDSNAGKLARWLRMMGYDALFFNDIDDAHLVDIALKEGKECFRHIWIPLRTPDQYAH